MLLRRGRGRVEARGGGAEGRKPLKPLNEKFNGHFRALPGMHNASNNQTLDQSCNQLPDAITRSRIFCDHLSQCAIVVSVPQWYSNVHERAVHSNTVPWPMRFVQWPQSLRNHVIRRPIYENQAIRKSTQQTMLQECVVFILARQSVLMQSGCTKKSLPNAVIPDNATGTRWRSNFTELHSQWASPVGPGQYAANARKKLCQWALHAVFNRGA